MLTKNQLIALLAVPWVLFFGLTAATVAQPRQLQTLREHPTSKSQPPAPATSPVPQGAAPVGSCTLEDGTEVEVYVVPKGAQ